jgi:hypothetical protein
MRESQMKKIIAAAVATAFVAPTYAADVSISGVLNYQWRDTSSSTTLAADGDSPLFTITASEELANGLTVSADMTHDLTTGSNDGGDSITIGGLPVGSVSIGDNGGALDSVGDYTDIAPEKGGFGADGSDHGIVIAFPAVNGFSAIASYSPKDGSPGSEANASGLSVTYSMGDTAVYYGTETYNGDTTSPTDETVQSAAGVKFNYGPLYIAAERGEKEETVGNTVSKMTFTGVAVSYKMGDITLGYENQRADVDGTATSYQFDDDTAATDEADASVVFVNYAVGGGLSVYAEAYSDSKESVNANEDQTTIGVKYAF